MIRKLAGLRNAVEHKYDDPPDQLRCAELLDFAWYFLRSTDRLVKYQLSDISVEFGSDEKYWISLRFDPDSKWQIDARGWLKKGMFSIEEKQDWIGIDVEKTNSRNVSDFYFIGKLIQGGDSMKKLIEIYFEKS